MNEHIIINDLPTNCCFICEKPFQHRNRYWTTKMQGLKEVELILCHPACRYLNTLIENYKNELNCCQVEKKGHSREVRELNKRIKEINQNLTDIEYKKFLKRYS